MSDLDKRFRKTRELLALIKQDHVLEGWDRLTESQRLHLLDEIQSMDWPEIHRLVKSHVLARPEMKLPEDLEPAPFFPHLPEGQLCYQYQEAHALGQQLIREGKVAAFIVAGGQGTRLGLDAPKGTFPATPIRQAPLFQVFAEFIAKVQHKYKAVVPWYIMTSQANDRATRRYFEKQGFFGLDPQDVVFFTQGMLPALDMETGRVLMEAPDRLALSPNGHGGSLKALYSSGAIEDMRSRGIEHISYFQVDNPNVKCVDPLFIGLHAQQGAEMSSKMLVKADSRERVGNFAMADGRLHVIEYSDLPDALADQREENGELRFRAGSIAIHLLTVDFVESINTADGGFGLPFHRAVKKVPHYDFKAGRVVHPAQPNAVKLETFVFDALPLCSNSIILETDRTEEFAPIKNADACDEQGRLTSVDCPASSRALQIERAANWLEELGHTIPRDDNDDAIQAVIEITPRAAVEPGDLEGMDLPACFEAGGEYLIDQA